MSFAGKVVIVTGAGSGIGAAVAVSFAKQGAHLALVDCNQDRLDRISQQCAALGTPPLPIRADISNEKETSAIVRQTTAHFGNPDVLVNNVGITARASITDPNILQMFDEVMNTNLRAVVQLTGLAAPHLKVTNGSIINVSSVDALTVRQNRMPYCVSKACVHQFTRCAALELAASGIRVNSVNPGPVRTAWLSDYPVELAEAMWAQAASSTALGKVCEPEEIADAVLFLASDKAAGITGSAFVCDNGYLLKH